MSQQVSCAFLDAGLLLVVPPQLTSERPVLPPPSRRMHVASLPPPSQYFQSDVPARRRKSSLLPREPRPTHRALVTRRCATADTPSRTIHALLRPGRVWVNMGAYTGFFRVSALHFTGRMPADGMRIGRGCTRPTPSRSIPSSETPISTRSRRHRAPTSRVWSGPAYVLLSARMHTDGRYAPPRVETLF
ncbi:hypothetical protein B0H15DRAFT_380123 [Mycena belliarum]|uniref:Uncharacterized protein n=1 Tax=Mycena belliarum TaxID=1033014 RepID=A0AAD6XKN5_9AGAR|nr:hypothetical protein B0H15DRAFT_380123 [Mycena belliae]